MSKKLTTITLIVLCGVIITMLAVFVILPQISNKRYISRSLDQCAVIDFACKEDEEIFQDKIGCGCKKI